jgi:hypothetical protein
VITTHESACWALFLFLFYRPIRRREAERFWCVGPQ